MIADVDSGETSAHVVPFFVVRRVVPSGFGGLAVRAHVAGFDLQRGATCEHPI